jgi:hypothetical protein
MTDNVEKQVRNDMVDDLIPGAKEKRESDALQAKLARAERSVYGSGYGYGTQGRFDDRYWERGGDALDDLGTPSYRKASTTPYKAPYTAPLTRGNPTKKIVNLMETGVTHHADRVEVTPVVMNKIVNELVGMVEETLEGADFTWKTGGSKLFRETFKLAMIETMEIWSQRSRKDLPISVANEDADDEDMYDDWYKKMCDLCQKWYCVTPIDDFNWSKDGIRSVWFNGSTAEWMARHFGEKEGLVNKSKQGSLLDTPHDPETGEIMDDIDGVPLEPVKIDRFTGEVIEGAPKKPSVTLDD